MTDITLEELVEYYQGDRHAAKMVLDLIHRNRHPRDFEEYRKLTRGMYHHPTWVEAVLMLADSWDEGSFGVESIETEHGELKALYLNTGDTYSPTILWDESSGHFYLTTWGDWLEDTERKMSELDQGYRR